MCFFRESIIPEATEGSFFEDRNIYGDAFDQCCHEGRGEHFPQNIIGLCNEERLCCLYFRLLKMRIDNAADCIESPTEIQFVISSSTWVG